MARIPAAYVDYHNDDLAHGKLTPKFKKLAIQGIDLEVQIKALKKQQDEIKSALKEEFGEDQKLTIVVPGSGSVPLVPKEEVVVADADRLAAIFGNNFANFVKASVSYKALQPLVDLVNDEDAPTHNMVLEATALKESCAISFKAEKK